MKFCGFDFGTSNSAIGIVDGAGPRLVVFGEDPVVRSAIFVDVEEHVLRYGAPGVEDYLGGIPGRLIMSLKSVLGSRLMDETTLIDGTPMPYSKVLGLLVAHIKGRAEQSLGSPLSHVVLGRPVRFSDDDDERDARAEQTLRDIAYSIGFEHVEFQYEPVAAALAFEARVDREQLCCVVDLGGGTADFSVIRIGPDRKARDRSGDVLANHGVHIGGTDLDYRLSLATVMPALGLGSLLRGSSGDVEMPTYYYHELSRWHRIFEMYRPEVRQSITTSLGVSYDRPALKRLAQVLEQRLGHHLLAQVERCKQTLSASEVASIELTLGEEGDALEVSRDRFVGAISGDIARLRATLTETLRRAGVGPGDIDCAILTGGTGLVPSVRAALTEALAPVELLGEDPFTAVARGLTLDAMERFR